MNAIVGEAVVSCYVDVASLLVMILLLVLSERLRHRASMSLRLFYMLSLCVTANCVFSFLYNAMYMQPAPWCHTVAVAGKTLREITVVATVVLWLVYVDHKLYGEKNRFLNKYRFVFLPFAAILILLMVNPFTGVLFTYSEENRIEPRALLYAVFAVEFIYFAFSAVIARYYDRKSMKTRFLHVSPMIISIVLASSTQFFAPYDIGILGYVMGITLLYFSMISEFRFVDGESGLYNRGYLAYQFDMALAGKNSTNSALILETDQSVPAVFDILRTTLHQEGDVIRAEDKKYMMFSKADSRSTLQYLSSLVEEEVEKYNKEHPKEKIHITAHCRIRMSGEDSFTFLRTAIDEKEAGGEMRGIVSMISELDRLDKELKLAADIQINMLPMVFPPFPDRNEFDLFASMTPAKEVGGDFYDFFLIDRDHLGLVIADVSGKGIPAALFMTVSKTLIKNQLMAGSDPAEALEHVNLQLCEHNSSMMFVTVWLAVLEISTGRGTVCNAGHENPAVRLNGGPFELLRYKHDRVVGALKKSEFHQREFLLCPGDCLFVYTDGVPEATDANKEMFGATRLAETLNRDADAGPRELVLRVHDEINRFVDGTPQFDDTTMLCLKYYGAQNGGEEGPREDSSREGLQEDRNPDAGNDGEKQDAGNGGE